MPRITIEGVPPYNGDHEIDLNYMTNRELHTVKKISGILPGDIEEAGRKGDTDLIVAIAVIALRRKGLVVDEDTLWDAQVGKILFVNDEADALPPPQPTSGTGEKPTEPNASSGASGKSDGGSPQENDPSSTGTQPSASSAT